MILNMISGGSGCVLTVTAPAGAVVTASKDGRTLTKTAASGTAVFRGLETGEWTVTISNGEQTSQPQTVTVTADYAVALTFFAATINVTYPAGSVCTATDGTTTLPAPDKSGTWACTVPNAGTWTVSLDSGFSETVTISENGTYTIDKWHIYDRGNEHTDITGGWNEDTLRGWVSDAVTASKATDCLLLKKTAKTSSEHWPSIGYISAAKINISDFTTLHIEFSANGSYTNNSNVVVYILDGVGGSVIGENRHSLISESSGKLAFDLSGIDRAYNVHVGVTDDVSRDNVFTAQIHEVYVE